ncbi:MAG: DUF6687 family protein [Hymenobacter sp.]
MDSTGLGAALTLAHWRGAATPRRPARRHQRRLVPRGRCAQPATPGSGGAAVTANHFDVDGFIGVWALLNPALALAHEDTAAAGGYAGRFPRTGLAAPAGRPRVATGVLAERRRKKPLLRALRGPARPRAKTRLRPRNSLGFCRASPRFCCNPEAGRAAWEPECQRVRQAVAALAGPLTQRTGYPDIGLAVVRTPAPVPYYALFGPTAGLRLRAEPLRRPDATSWNANTPTWIDLESRPALPRPAPGQFSAARLNDAGNQRPPLGRRPAHRHRPAAAPGWPPHSQSRALRRPRWPADLRLFACRRRSWRQEVVAFLRAGYAGMEAKEVLDLGGGEGEARSKVWGHCERSAAIFPSVRA